MKLQYSLKLFQKAEDLLNQMDLKPNGYAAVHIRRGDLKKVIFIRFNECSAFVDFEL